MSCAKLLASDGTIIREDVCHVHYKTEVTHKLGDKVEAALNNLSMNKFEKMAAKLNESDNL